jgi:hypothetical protein
MDIYSIETNVTQNQRQSLGGGQRPGNQKLRPINHTPRGHSKNVMEPLKEEAAGFKHQLHVQFSNYMQDINQIHDFLSSLNP